MRIVIPYPAGGGTDTIGRLVADQLSRKWGQPVVVENVGGAAGNVGAAQVFRAAPDGYTMMIASPGPIATNSFLYKDMPFDPARWTSIALLATGPYVLVLRKNFEGATIKDLIARAKAAPGKITAATPGVGSVGHLATVQLEMLGRDQDDAGALSGLESRGERSHRRPCRPDVRHADDLAAAASRRPREDDRDRHHRARRANSPRFRPLRKRCPAIAR